MIRLYLANGTWMADTQFAANADEVRRLFGTDQLPTPYTDKTPARCVYDAIARANPSEQVNVTRHPDFIFVGR